MGESCGICEGPAIWLATVPMCGERPRYPLCEGCLGDLMRSDFAEDVDLLSTDRYGGEPK